jgi:hypothetical protein
MKWLSVFSIEKPTSGLQRLRPSIFELRSLIFLGVNSNYLTCEAIDEAAIFSRGFLNNLKCGCTDAATEQWEGPADDPILNCIPRGSAATTSTSTSATTMPLVVQPTGSNSESIAPLAIGASLSIIGVMVALVLFAFWRQR